LIEYISPSPRDPKDGSPGDRISKNRSPGDKSPEDRSLGNGDSGRDSDVLKY